MLNLVNKLENLKKTDISKLISARLQQFREQKPEKVFSELCFCLLTANFRADKCIQIQQDIGNGFELLSQEELASKLKQAGHRFWSQRAERIVRARKYKSKLNELISKCSGSEIREWLVENIYGMGMKEASHFLRNIGYTDLAIIDFHIIDLLVGEGLIERPKTLTSRRYLEIEQLLRTLGERARLNLAELDLYLWYMETGKILK